MIKDRKYAPAMNWKEIQQEFESGTLVVIPIGAGCKEHGLHLPSNTDKIQAEYFANLLAAQYNILIMDTMTDGYYPSFTEYAGTVSLTSDQCRDLYVKKCETWHQQGAWAFYFLNYGVSTHKPLKAAQDILREKGIQMYFTDLSDFRKILMALPEGQRPEQIGGTHADEVETSIMLAINPKLVNLSEAKKDFDNKPGRLVPFKPDPHSDDCYSPTGAFGDPTLATAEKGAIYIQKMTEYCLKDLERYFNDQTTSRL